MLIKKIILSILIFCPSLYYTQNAWGEEVFLVLEEKPLRYVLNEIREQSSINIIFNDSLVHEKKLSCNIKSTAENAIDEVLTKTGLSYRKFNNNSVVIIPKNISFNKTKAVVRNKKIEKEYIPIESEVSKPALLSNLDLIYPQDAVREGLEGEVLARILVSKTGIVTDIKLDKSSGHEILDTATINYVRKLKFLPAEINGKYQSAWTSMLVKFNFE